MSVEETQVRSESEKAKDDRGRLEIIQPRLGFVGWLRWSWRQLTSMRTALFLLLLLAVAAIPGSVFPQTRIDQSRVQTFLTEHRNLGPWVRRLDGFDVYSSPWFSAIYLLLFISLIGCVLPRSRQHWKASRALPPKAPRRLERLPNYHTSDSDLPAADVLAAARTSLRRRHYRVAAHDSDSVSAERGFLSETGNLVFHLSLIGLLIAVAVGSFFGYHGQVVVVVGDSFGNTLSQYDSFNAGRSINASNLPPFSFKLDSLDVKFDTTSRGNQFGAARNFTARVTYQSKPGAPAQLRIVKVNKPLDAHGARAFLVGNGYAPVVTIRDGNGNIAVGPGKGAGESGGVPFTATDEKYTSNGVIKAPDALPTQIGLQAFLLPTEATLASGQPVSIFPGLNNPRLVFTAYTGDLGMDSGAPRSVSPSA